MQWTVSQISPLFSLESFPYQLLSQLGAILQFFLCILVYSPQFKSILLGLIAGFWLPLIQIFLRLSKLLKHASRASMFLRL